jgi:hypothetical protein
LERYIASNDPHFEKKADIIDLYLNPPQHAAVFCVDEKTANQTLDCSRRLGGRTTWAKQIHVVPNNLSAHKTKDAARFLAEHPPVHFHLTPTYSSWLNQVELWFAKSRGTSSHGVCSVRWPISATSSATTSATTPNQPRDHS